jgi:BirA family transcriptional regulator, biotin operon repressor / biotin---[acetyl-CoA-carboxylase] ligase
MKQMSNSIKKKIVDGHLFIILDEIDSTNHFLHDYDDDKDYRIIVALSNYQTSGRGQGSNSWESEKYKNLTFSFLIHPTYVAPNIQFVISMAISMAIKDCLDNYFDDVSIKWPNDIYYRDMKICGILIENNLCGSSIKDSVLGVGININQQKFVSDAPNPVSMWNILGKKTDTEEILNKVIENFSEYMDQMEQGDFDEIRHNYLFSLYRKEGYFPYSDVNGVFTAKLETVESDGHLKLIDIDNKSRRYAFKEVKFMI